MGRSNAFEVPRIRLLALGNDLLADDRVGLEIGRAARQRFPELDVVLTEEAGFALLDYVVGVDHLIVVDAIQTGRAEPGHLWILGADDLANVRAVMPHGAGLKEVLELAQGLQLEAPARVTLLGIEAADCTTIGATISEAVLEAVPRALQAIEELIRNGVRSSEPADR